MLLSLCREIQTMRQSLWVLLAVLFVVTCVPAAKADDITYNLNLDTRVW